VNLRPVPWIEPAHPSIVRIYDDLIQVYREMKNSQRQIDEAFDRVASQIGFVVTTTIPVRVEVDEKHTVQKVELDCEALKGTLFAEVFSPLIRELAPKSFANASPGSYRFYLLWYDALNLKLRRDWMEPAHVLQGLLGSFMPQASIAESAAAVRPEVCEPAHWFDPGIALAVEDVVAISAIDQVYPELRLAERISADRLAVRQISAHVKEPAHFLRPEVREPAHFRAASVRPEVQEPAHFQNVGAQFMAELRALLQRFGQ
jgi:hypothetical protein